MAAQQGLEAGTEMLWPTRKDGDTQNRVTSPFQGEKNCKNLPRSGQYLGRKRRLFQQTTPMQKKNPLQFKKPFY